MRFYIVDVFAETKYSGNQLAVFRDSGKLTGAQMQRIAQEMHYSESTFILSETPRDGSFDVRVFTPNQELPFAGHPTLGTAYIIQSRIIGEQVERVTLNYKVGQIPVAFSYKERAPDVLWMRQKPPTFGKTLGRGRAAKALGLKASEIDPDYPVQLVSTGLPFVIVPLTGLKAIRRITVDQRALTKLFRETKTTVILVFTSETYSKENDLNVRVLGTQETIPEDPATGSGNGCLAAYLVKQRYFGKDSVNVRVEQGYEIGRKSLLLLKAGRKEGKIEVNVGGRVQFIAEGEFPDK